MMVSYAMEPHTSIDMPGTPFGRSRDYTGEEALTPGRRAGGFSRWAALTAGAPASTIVRAITRFGAAAVPAPSDPTRRTRSATGQTHRKVGTQSHRSTGPAHGRPHDSGTASQASFPAPGRPAKGGAMASSFSEQRRFPRRACARPRAPHPHESAAVLTECRDLARARIAGRWPPSSSGRGRALRAGGKARDSESQALTSMCARRRATAPAMEAAFRRQFLALCNREVKGGAAAPARPSATRGALAVDDDELEHALAVRAMAASSRARARASWARCRSASASCLENPDLADDANPVSPETVCRALKDACDQLEAGMEGAAHAASRPRGPGRGRAATRLPRPQRPPRVATDPAGGEAHLPAQSLRAARAPAPARVPARGRPTSTPRSRAAGRAVAPEGGGPCPRRSWSRPPRAGSCNRSPVCSSRARRARPAPKGSRT